MSVQGHSGNIGFSNPDRRCHGGVRNAPILAAMAVIANALGITIAQSVLVREDEVIR